MRPLFSICVPVKNEEETLPTLFSSLGEFMGRGGELLVIDTGSSDRTISVAEDFGAIVVAAGGAFLMEVSRDEAAAINAAYVDTSEPPVIAAGDRLFNYAAARNYAHSIASNDMILIAGADSSFPTMNIDELNHLIDAGHRRFEIQLTERPGNVYFTEHRMYDRDYYTWEGTMHEHLVQTKPCPPDYRLPPEVLSMGNHPKPNHNRSKYLANLAYSYWKDPSDVRQAHCFGRQLMYEKRYRSAIAMLTRHFMMGGNHADIPYPLS